MGNVHGDVVKGIKEGPVQQVIGDVHGDMVKGTKETKIVQDNIMVKRKSIS